MGCISVRKRRPTHQNKKRNKLYRTWKGMRTRCDRLESPYHKKGIRYDLRWKSYATFCEDMEASFVEHVSKHGESNTSLDRVDFRGDYSRENCRWVTNTIQARNRSTNKFVTHDGKTMTLAEWGELTGVRPSVIGARLELGWPMERAITVATRSWVRR